MKNNIKAIFLGLLFISITSTTNLTQAHGGGGGGHGGGGHGGGGYHGGGYGHGGYGHGGYGYGGWGYGGGFATGALTGAAITANSGSGQPSTVIVNSPSTGVLYCDQHPNAPEC